MGKLYFVRLGGPRNPHKLKTLPEHQSSLPIFSGVRVTRSLALCICFIDRCLSLCTFSFGHCAAVVSQSYASYITVL